MHSLGAQSEKGRVGRQSMQRWGEWGGGKGREVTTLLLATTGGVGGEHGVGG